MFRKVILAILTFAAVGTAVLWAAGYLTTLTWQHRRPTQLLVLAVDRGELICRYRSSTLDWHSPAGPSGDAWPFKRVEKRVPVIGIRFVWSQAIVGPEASLRGGKVIVPLWLIFVAWILYPALALLRGPVRRKRRRRRGLCLSCGYNLTGNTSGVCPECGTAADGPRTTDLPRIA